MHALRRGKLTFDDLVNRQEHEDGPRKAGGGESGISRTIRVGDAPLDFDAPPIEVEEKFTPRLSPPIVFS